MKNRGTGVRSAVPGVAGLALAALLATPGPAQAHPHAWIDVSTELRFDESGAVTAIRETWLFDEYYTVFAVQGLDADGDGKPDPDKLAELLEINLTNLAEYDYFTRVWAGGERLEVEPAVEGTNAMRDGRLEMSFLLPLRTPAAADGGKLVYKIFDPTYYIEMLHRDTEQAVELRDAPEGCTASVERGDPPLEAIGLATSLDSSVQGETSYGDKSLGALFAETVTVSCP
jgi:ABC-type uncharacterized transport system substrate-binding protein